MPSLPRWPGRPGTGPEAATVLWQCSVTTLQMMRSVDIAYFSSLLVPDFVNAELTKQQSQNSRPPGSSSGSLTPGVRTGVSDWVLPGGAGPGMLRLQAALRAVAPAHRRAPPAPPGRFRPAAT